MRKEIVINNEILDKVHDLDESENIKKFLVEALIWEYDNIDEQKPRVTKKFDDLVSKYVGE